jgi:hypothetical protein
MTKDETWQELHHAVFALARDAVVTQMRLDEGVAERRARFAAALSALPEPARRALLPLAPPAIVVSEHRVTCALRVSTARSLSFSLVAKPINAGYCALYGVTEAERCSLTIEVKQAPAQEPEPQSHRGEK